MDCDFKDVNWCNLECRPCDYHTNSCPYLEEYERRKNNPTVACDYTYLQDAERKKTSYWD